jgi:hypothetical protein
MSSNDIEMEPQKMLNWRNVEMIYDNQCFGVKMRKLVGYKNEKEGGK